MSHGHPVHLHQQILGKVRAIVQIEEPREGTRAFDLSQDVFEVRPGVRGRRVPQERLDFLRTEETAPGLDRSKGGPGQKERAPESSA
jgi:hypothetical protein